MRVVSEMMATPVAFKIAAPEQVQVETEPSKYSLLLPAPPKYNSFFTEPQVPIALASAA